MLDLVLSLLALQPPQPVAPQPPAREGRAIVEQVEIDGFRFNSEEPISRAVRRSLEAQVRILNALRVQPRVLAFFRSQPIRLTAALGQAGASGPAGVVLAATAVPPDNPVLLHELLHLYHFRALPGGIENPTVEAAYEAARASGTWPARSYMLSNKREFFAMTASAVLHGSVARPPFTREAVRTAMPAYYAWLLEEFARP